MNFISKIRNKLVYNYILHNKNFFSKTNSNKQILLEFNAYQSTHVAFSYLSNVLAKRHEAYIQPFFNYYVLISSIFPSFLQRFKWYVSKKLSLNNHAIYKSFGSSECMKPNIKDVHFQIAKKNTKKIFSKIKNKNDILKIKYKNLLVGDLLYDTFLKSKREPTISNINSVSFLEFTTSFFALCEFWIEYFNNNKIKAVITSHTVYSFAIPLRIAISKKIEAYGCTSRHIYKLDYKNYRMHTHTIEHRKIFKKFDSLFKKKGFKKVKKILNNRILGYTKVDAGFFGNVKVSPFNKKFIKKKILNSKKIKILILPHDFFDAVHIYGMGIFPDFYEWLKFLGEYSKKNKNYEWYIKLRPDYKGKYKLYHDHTSKLIDNYLIKYPHIKILPNNYSLYQIKKEKIDFVLTVHGTAAIDFALINGPKVINASPNNPHATYKFSISPKNFQDYLKTLNNLKKIKKSQKKIDTKEIYEYYFMRHFYNNKDWLINSKKLMDFIGGKWEDQFSTKFYTFWINEFSEKKHKKILLKINNFLNSNDRNINIRY